MREWIIAIDNQTNEICVVSLKKYLNSPAGVYTAIDDSSSEYKAKIKVKEIKAIGLQRYEDMRVDELLAIAESVS